MIQQVHQDFPLLKSHATNAKASVTASLIVQHGKWMSSQAEVGMRLNALDSSVQIITLSS